MPVFDAILEKVHILREAEHSVFESGASMRQNVHIPQITLDFAAMEGDMTEPRRIWQLKDARANFSTLVDRAISDGPQIVTRNGKNAVVVVAIDAWMRRERLRGDLVDFFAQSPLREEGIEIERQRDYPRELEF
jgi:prevent-host-death family protein